MKNIGYGKDYKYAHDFESNFVEQEFLPEKIRERSSTTRRTIPAKMSSGRG